MPERLAPGEGRGLLKDRALCMANVRREGGRIRKKKDAYLSHTTLLAKASKART
jgi:hypothetical protein